ncbi:hypothetical protein [Paenibacillus sp. FSL W7-1287]|uniref:hypothetical protein n=1 Tax=Paenibacillus sp. FSL W7-1287 TaxID=2954538 RepID=UPI0030FC076A
MEGMVAKKYESTYQSRRSKDWLKIINYKYIDAYVKGMMTEEFGWIIEIDTNEGRQYGGVIHVGVPLWAKSELSMRIKAFTKERKKKAVYWKEDIPITVKFRAWTENGLLRIPEFDGFR